MTQRIGRPTHLTGGGTTVIAAFPAELLRVVVNTEAAGQTLALHNAASGAAANPGNMVASLKLDARDDFEYGSAFDVGIVAIVSGGAPDVTVVMA